MPTEGKRIEIGGNVTNSNIIVGDHNTLNVQAGRKPLSAERISQLTDQYKRAIERDWSTLRVDQADYPLTDVYVMLQAMGSPPPIDLEERAELAELPERMKHAGLAPKESTPDPVELSQALKEAEHLVLLGRPGSGKSTTLQFIGLCFVHQDWAESRLQLTEERIPIKLDLRGYADILAHRGTAMEEALSRAIRERLRDISEDESYELIQAWRDQSQLLVLLDGLDEVSDQHKEAVRNEIQKFALWAPDKQCRLVMSSRLPGYSTMGGRFKEFTLKPFEQSGEAIPFLQNWLVVLRSDWGAERVQRETINLHNKMNAQPALHRILDNPLLLRISAQLYSKTGQIATNRTDLYHRYIEELWIRAVERGVERIEKDKVWNTIEDVAWRLQTGDTPAITVEMDIIFREKMGLLIPIGDRWFFSHTTLQEFFVARRLERAWRASKTRTWSFLRSRLHIAAWREPVMLLCVSMDAEDARNLAQRVVTAHSPYESHLFRDTLLGATLMIENNKINGPIRETVIHSLVKAFKGKDWKLREAASVVLHQIGKDTVPHLIRMLKARDRGIRRLAVETLGKIQDKGSIPFLMQALSDSDVFVSGAAQKALGVMKKEEPFPELIRLFKGSDWSMRSVAAQALNNLEVEKAIPDLIGALDDEDSEVRGHCARILGQARVFQAVPKLINLLKHEDPFTRKTMCETLGEMGAVEAIPDLIQVLMYESWEMRWAAANALEKIGRNAEEELTRLLSDEDIRVREMAAEVLGKINTTKAPPALIPLLKDENSEAQKAAVETVPHLITLLPHSSWQVRRRAAWALGDLQSVEAVPYLIRLIRSKRLKNVNVQTAVEDALFQIGQGAIPYLIEALQDQDSDVCQSAAWVLGKLRSPDAVPHLIEMLDDADRHLRHIAAWALGEIRAPEAIHHLLPALRERDKKMHKRAAEALRDILVALPLPIENRQLREQLYAMRRLMSSKLEYDDKLMIAERLALLEATMHPYQDPFERPTLARAWRILWSALYCC